MRLNVLTATTVLAILSVVPPLHAQSPTECHSQNERQTSRCDSEDYHLPLMDMGVTPEVYPARQPLRSTFPSSSFPAAWVRMTRLELTSETDDWVTVSIEGIDNDVELSFTRQQATQSVNLEPGIYRLRFRPTLSSLPWQSGYMGVGRTNLLRIVFDQQTGEVTIFDDPDSWSPDGVTRHE